MLQKIVEVYVNEGLLFLAVFMISFVFYILSKYAKNDKLSTVFFAIAALCAVGSLPISIPMYVLILFNTHWISDRLTKMMETAYTLGRAEGAKKGIDDLHYLMSLSRFRDYTSWRSHKLKEADMSEDDLRAVLNDDLPKSRFSNGIGQYIVFVVVILFIFLFFYCAGEIHPVEI